jgi:hypothetical protein
MPIEDHQNFMAFETERSVLFSKLRSAQDLRGRFLQCLRTPAAKTDGTMKVAFDTRRKPSDEQEDWRDLDVTEDVALGTRLQYAIDVYAGPRGNGYIVSALVEFNNELWQYREHIGPERRPGV